MSRHFIVNYPGDGDVLVSDDSGTVTDLEDDICLVYGGNNASDEEKEAYAERIAKLLNMDVAGLHYRMAATLSSAINELNHAGLTMTALLHCDVLNEFRDAFGEKEVSTF